MGEAKRRKKLDPNWGKGLGKKRLTHSYNFKKELDIQDRATRRSPKLERTRSYDFQEELDIQVIEDIPQRIEKMMPELSPDLIGSLYLGVNQGIIRGILRFDIYEIWMNPDFSIETKNEILSMIWRIDEQEDEEMLQKWFNDNEQKFRDFGTNIWSKLHYKTLDLKIR